MAMMQAAFPEEDALDATLPLLYTGEGLDFVKLDETELLPNHDLFRLLTLNGVEEFLLEESASLEPATTTTSLKKFLLEESASLEPATTTTTSDEVGEVVRKPTAVKQGQGHGQEAIAIGGNSIKCCNARSNKRSGRSAPKRKRKRKRRLTAEQKIEEAAYYSLHYCLHSKNACINLNRESVVQNAERIARALGAKAEYLRKCEAQQKSFRAKLRTRYLELKRRRSPPS